MKRNTIEEKVGSVITIESFLEIFDNFLVVKKVEGCANTTIQGYRNNMDKCFCRFLEVEQIDKTIELDINLIRSYIGYLQDKGLKGSTINIRLRTLRSYIRWFNKEGIIDNSIPVKFKLVKQEEKKIQILTDLQVNKILSVIDTSKYSGFRDYIAIQMMLETGVRNNEMINIKISDVDLERRLIIIRPETAKTRRERHLPITKALRKNLKELIEIAKTKEYDYIFQKHTTSQFTTATIRKAVHQYKNFAKIKGMYHHTS